MKRCIAIFAILFTLPLSLVFGQNQKVFPLSSEIYDEMDALYLMRGLGTPSTARPWTASEAQLILERVAADSLNQREQALYDFIATEISRPLRFLPDNLFSLGVKLDLALEAYTHTNTNDFVLSRDWNYGFEERQPPVKLSLDMALSSWFYTYTDFQLSRNRFTSKDDFRSTEDLDQGIGAITNFPDPYSFPWRSRAYSSAFLTNIPGTGEFDFDWPKRAYISFGGKHWNLSLARDRIQWGRGQSGNFVVDGHREYDDYLRFSAFSEKFKYEWLNVFYSSPEVGSSFKFLMAHRLEFRIMPSLVIALAESLMCRPDAFDPRYLNPAFVYHNWYDRDNLNSLVHLEIDFVPFNGYRFYTQAGIDQIKAPWESNDEPGAWGIIAGVEHIRPVLQGILSLSLEGAYTTPLLYRRDLVDFITLSETQVNSNTQYLDMDYTGYPYGGDAIVLQLDANYRLIGSALLHARLFGMIHGKTNFFTLHNDEGNTEKPNITDTTPSGGKDEWESTLGISLGGNYTIPQPVSWLTLRTWAQLDLIVIKNKLMLSETGINEDIVYHKNGVTEDFQVSVGVGVSF